VSSVTIGFIAILSFNFKPNTASPIKADRHPDKELSLILPDCQIVFYGNIMLYFSCGLPTIPPSFFLHWKLSQAQGVSLRSIGLESRNNWPCPADRVLRRTQKVDDKDFGNAMMLLEPALLALLFRSGGEGERISAPKSKEPSTYMPLLDLPKSRTTIKPG
jgi:hypothetical protein